MEEVTEERCNTRVHTLQVDKDSNGTLDVAELRSLIRR